MVRNRSLLFGLMAMLVVATSNSLAKEKAPAQQKTKVGESEKSAVEPGNTTSGVTAEYCRKTLSKVDEIISKNIYSDNLAKNEWPAAKAEFGEKICASTDLYQLDRAMNLAIKKLHSSHCQFVTVNDETYYFLNSLFSRYNHKLKATKMDFTGIVCGGLGLPDNQVRYIIDGSPGDLAKVQVGDKILAVENDPYVGQENFSGKSGRPLPLSIERAGNKLSIAVKPVFRDVYGAYVEGISKSAKIIETKEGKLGYIHSWAGGQEAHDALEWALEDKLAKTDGLILDLRDGYGGNSLSDLDYFYRNPQGYPVFSMKDRSGKVNRSAMVYDKPVVALINGGSRSGKELLAFSLKKTGRARLVGQRTAGSVLAGKLFPIDDRCALYLAVAGGDVGGVQLEGHGVEPDVVVPDSSHSLSEENNQFEKAKEELILLLKKHPSPEKHES